jgi:hypothetical protein
MKHVCNLHAEETDGHYVYDPLVLYRILHGHEEINK